MSILKGFKIVSDIVSAGSFLANTRLVMKATSQLKSENPEDYQIYIQLLNVTTQSKLDFDSLATPDGKLLLRSKTLVSGWTSHPEFNCAAHVADGLVVIMYRPEYAEFVVDNRTMHFLINWVNERVTFGRFTQFGNYRNNVGRDIQQTAYFVEVNCKGVPEEFLEKTLDNALSKVIMFRELFMPIIKPVDELELTVEANGTISGEKAGEVIRNFQIASSKLNREISKEYIKYLKNQLQDSLEEVGYYLVEENEDAHFSVSGPKDEEHKISMHIYLNQHGQLVLQSYSSIFENLGSIIQTSDYLLFVNRNSTGRYYYDHSINRVIYRNCLDLLGLGDQFPKVLFSHLMKEHFEANGLYLPGFQFLKSPHDPPEDILSNIIEGTPVEVPEMPELSIIKNLVIDSSIENHVTKGETEKISQPKSVTAFSLKAKVSSEVEGTKEETEQISQPVSVPTSSLKAKVSSDVGGTKEGLLVILIEGLLGLFGLLGLGWLYAGKHVVGILILAGAIVWDIFALILTLSTSGLGILCVLPIHLLFVGSSTLLLRKYVKDNPVLFR